MNKNLEVWLESLKNGKHFCPPYTRHKYGISFGDLKPKNLKGIQGALISNSSPLHKFSAERGLNGIVFGFTREEDLDGFIAFCASYRYIPCI